MNLGVAIHTCNPSTLEIEVGGFKVPPLFHTEFNTNLRCIRFYLKRKKERVLNLAPGPLACRLGTVSVDLALTSFSCQLDIAQSPLRMGSLQRVCKPQTGLTHARVYRRLS